MSRMMLERNIEMTLGDAHDALTNGRKRCKAKLFGVLIDANLIADDIREWAGMRASEIRNCLREGGYAMSDAIDDADYALFNDNTVARRVTLGATAAGLGVLAAALSAIRIGRARREQ